MFLKSLAEYSHGVGITLHCPSPHGAFTDPLCLGVDVRTVDLNSTFFWHVWEQLFWPLTAKGLAINPINTGPFFPCIQGHVVFAHDLNVLRFPENYGWKFRWWYKFASCRAIRRARHVVCFSQHVKKDLINFLTIAPERITVLPQGPGLPVSGVETPRKEREPFFLCVGSMQPHKNLAGCLSAWKISGLALQGYRLKVVGKPQSNYSPMGIDATLLNQPGIEFTGYLSDQSLMDFYRTCTGFVYPSFEEGFGLPIVEAFYLGAPVITSDRSCLPEIAGSAALLVDPYDHVSIAGAMTQLAECPVLRDQLMEEGSRRAELYSWKAAGRGLFELIQKIDAQDKF